MCMPRSSVTQHACLARPPLHHPACMRAHPFISHLLNWITNHPPTHQHIACRHARLNLLPPPAALSLFLRPASTRCDVGVSSSSRCGVRESSSSSLHPQAATARLPSCCCRPQSCHCCYVAATATGMEGWSPASVPHPPYPATACLTPATAAAASPLRHTAAEAPGGTRVNTEQQQEREQP